MLFNPEQYHLYKEEHQQAEAKPKFHRNTKKTFQKEPLSGCGMLNVVGRRNEQSVGNENDIEQFIQPGFFQVS